MLVLHRVFTYMFPLILFNIFLTAIILNYNDVMDQGNIVLNGKPLHLWT